MTEIISVIRYRYDTPKVSQPARGNNAKHPGDVAPSSSGASHPIITASSGKHERSTSLRQATCNDPEVTVSNPLAEEVVEEDGDYEQETEEIGKTCVMPTVQ